MLHNFVSKIKHSMLSVLGLYFIKYWLWHCTCHSLPQKFHNLPKTQRDLLPLLHNTKKYYWEINLQINLVFLNMQIVREELSYNNNFSSSLLIPKAGIFHKLFTAKKCSLKLVDFKSCPVTLRWKLASLFILRNQLHTKDHVACIEYHCMLRIVDTCNELLS